MKIGSALGLLLPAAAWQRRLPLASPYNWSVHTGCALPLNERPTLLHGLMY